MMVSLEKRLQRGLGDRYRIEREIGRGGMAVVYLAKDLKHDRPVALKVFRPEMGAHFGGERFLREIRLTAQLQHPGILALHDSGEVDGLLYYVMPFVEGESLRERLLREPSLPVPETVRLVTEVAEALDYAHARGIVHRDVKPENIMLSQGHALLADFGIAHALDAVDREHLTEAGLTLGTVGYMSPEQATAETLDGRSDQYALACVMYEMLVGQPPYGGATGVAIISRHLTEPTPSIQARRPEVPLAVEQAAARAMAKTAGERFATTREFAAALTASGPAAPTSIAATPARSVAVLPFADLSPKRDKEFLCEGLSEALQDALGHVAGLRVVSRTSAFAFKGKHVDAREIGRQLNVATLLEGSVQVAGERLRASVTLTDVADGYQLWSERYDRPLTDVFAVQDDIARTVVHRLLPRLTAELRAPLAVRATDDLEAYELYLKGRHVWNRRTEGALRQSVEYFRQALNHDPAFAMAQTGLADAFTMLGVYGAQAPAEAMPLAKSYAEEALRDHPNLADALVARASIRALYDWDWSGAAADFRTALAANPQYAQAQHWFAVHYLMPLGQFDEARDQLRAAQELDPLSPAIGTTVGLLYYLERRYDDAIGRYHEVLDLNEHFVLARYLLGEALTETGAHQDAVARLREALAEGGRSAEVVAALARAEALAGQTDTAESLLAELEATARTKYVSPVLLGQVYLALGRRDEALTLFAEGLGTRAVELVWLGVRPTFDAVRDDPRFLKLLERIGLRHPPTEPEHSAATRTPS